MAYRHLFAMTLAAGLALVACGGETGSGQQPGDVGASQPPGNSDQPNNDTDQPPSNTDRPPSGTDKPPGSSDDSAGTGGGGRLGPICDQFCAAIDQVVDECGMNSGDVAMEGLCSDDIDCSQIPSTPCDNEVAGLLRCFIEGLGGLCQAVSAGPNGEPQVPDADDLCRNELEAAQACSEANGLGGDDDEGPGSMNPPRSCTAMGGCACEDDCERCSCQAGTDVARIQACFMPGAACAE